MVQHLYILLKIFTVGITVLMRNYWSFLLAWLDLLSVVKLRANTYFSCKIGVGHQGYSCVTNQPYNDGRRRGTWFSRSVTDQKARPTRRNGRMLEEGSLPWVQ